MAIRTLLAWKGVELPGGDLDGDDPSTLAVDHDQVEHVELVEERHALLDALLIEGLKDHVAGPVGRVTGPHHRNSGLGSLGPGGGGLVINRVGLGVPAEPSLRDPPVGRPVEWQAHVLEVVDAVDGFLAENLGRRLVDQEVAPFDRVVGVVFPRVVFEVRQSGGDPSLSGPGVRPGRVELADDGGADPLARLERGHEPRAPGSDDDAVETMVIHATRLGRRHRPGRFGAWLGFPTLSKTLADCGRSRNRRVCRASGEPHHLGQYWWGSPEARNTLHFGSLVLQRAIVPYGLSENQQRTSTFRLGVKFPRAGDRRLNRLLDLERVGLDVGLVRLKHQDRIAARTDEQEGQDPGHRAGDDPTARGQVLIENLAKAVEAVDHGQADQGDVPEPPDPAGPGRGPAAGDERVIDRLDVVQDMHDEQVADRQEDQGQPRESS